MTAPPIRFATDLITFFDPPYWGLPADLAYPAWIDAFHERPREMFERMLDGVVEAGLEGIELAPEPGGWMTALRAYGSVEAIRAALDGRGLTLVSSYAPGRQLIGDAMRDPAMEAVADEALASHARFLENLGASIITIGNVMRSRFGNDSPDDTATAADFQRPVAREVHERFAGQLDRLGRIVARHGIRLAIHTDAYSICSRNEDIASVLALTDPATIGICLDAGHVTLDGGDAIAVLRDHIERIPIMHWKDCAEPLSGHVLRGDQKQRHARMLRNFRIMGAGRIDWLAWMDILREHRWTGWAIEEIDMSPDPVGELREGLRFYRESLEPRYLAPGSRA